MEKTKNKLSENQKLFFKNLSKYLNTKLYFYGSIQRFDFFKNKSDIDVCIFTDNMQTTKSKLASFLNISKKKFKKFIYNLHKTNKIVKGEKLEYTDEEKNIHVEFSIYNIKDKENVLKEYLSKTDLPFYVTWILLVLKFFYYSIPILPKSIYLEMKRFTMNYLVEGQDAEFVVY
jgi:hypothetical protein